MRAILRRTALSVIAVTLITACGGDSTAPKTTVAGTWSLQSINGASLPASFPPSNGSTITVTASTLNMVANGTYNEVISLRIVTGAATTTTTVSEVGTWTENNGSVFFSDQTDKTTYQGSVTGNTLTEIVDGFTQVYARQ